MISRSTGRAKKVSTTRQRHETSAAVTAFKVLKTGGSFQIKDLLKRSASSKPVL